MINYNANSLNRQQLLKSQKVQNRLSMELQNRILFRLQFQFVEIEKVSFLQGLKPKKY